MVANNIKSKLELDAYKRGFEDAIKIVKMADEEASDECEFDGTNSYYTDSFARTYERAIYDYTEYFWEYINNHMRDIAKEWTDGET